MSVLLAADTYDHTDETNSLSVTTLIKPIRQIILAMRCADKEETGDITSLTASTLGTAIHDALESSWLNHYKQSMTRMGYPQRIIDNILINPEPNEIITGSLPVYVEVRTEREIEGYTVSGKFDIVINGRLEDLKTTSVYGYQDNHRKNQYILQASIYRWLNPDKITDDTFAIQYVFLDWNQPSASRDKKYPKSKILEETFMLMSYAATKQYLVTKLLDITKHIDTPEKELPYCTDDDLWRKAPVWKYYRKPENKKRSTKNFDNEYDAMLKLADEGNVGEVVLFKGKVVACTYCPAYQECTQKDQYVASGDL